MKRKNVLKVKPLVKTSVSTRQIIREEVLTCVPFEAKSADRRSPTPDFNFGCTTLYVVEKWISTPSKKSSQEQPTRTKQEPPIVVALSNLAQHFLPLPRLLYPFYRPKMTEIVRVAQNLLSRPKDLEKRYRKELVESLDRPM